MIDFNKIIKASTTPKATDPIVIYSALDRTSVAGPLRPVQSDILSKWYEEYRSKKDLILKLHTGAGKTLIGLLMAMSYLNGKEGPVIYVCPNIYLMKQVCDDAKKFGVPFCTIGKNNDIPNAFIEGEKVLITYVQKVFNGLSIFGTGNRSRKVGCIILDDSHACIDAMLGSCTIQIMERTSENNKNQAYYNILKLVEDDLQQQGDGSLQDLLSRRPGAMMPIPYWTWCNKISKITQIISQNVDNDDHIKFAWPILKDQLRNCRAFISGTKIEISPVCLPIQQYGIFNNASHRILMSATTQEDTFFIRGLGLSVDAVNNPLIDENYHWSGEKMILIPEDICGSDCKEQLVKKLIKTDHDYGIAVLTPSLNKAKEYRDMGAVIANESSNAEDMYNILQNHLKNYANQTIVFANRYDGIDLPDDSCRILIIDSVPYSDCLADRYEEKCRTESEIIRTKIVQKIEQGLGRSVRGEKDYCAILILGGDLTSYIRSADNRNIFSPQTREQINIGFEISNMGSNAKQDTDDIISTIQQCLSREDGWKNYYSSRMDSIQYTTRERTKLLNILQQEKKAYDEENIGNYEKAASIMQDIANSCEVQSEKAWYLQEKARLLYNISQSRAEPVQEAAYKINTQLLKPQKHFNGNEHTINHLKCNQIIQEMRKYNNFEDFYSKLECILDNLSIGTEADTAESAYCKLGELLGYSSSRPDKETGQGPDVLWGSSDNNYILIECKTEVKPSRDGIDKSEAGQMEQHCAWFEHKYHTNNYLPVIVIATNSLSGKAHFSHNIEVLKDDGISRLKKQVEDFFIEFINCNLSGIDADFVNKQLVVHKLHDDYFIRKFTTLPIDRG